MSTASDPVVIVSAARTPLGRFMGELTPFSAHQLGSHVIAAALERAKLKPERIDEVFMGCVLPAGQGQAPARQAARGAGLPDATGAFSDLAPAAPSALAVAYDGPAIHTKSPVATINAERPLALMFMWQSPRLPAPRKAQ